MNNTHKTQQNNTHTASHKISLRLLALLFACILWGVSPSQAAQKLLMKGENNDKKNIHADKPVPNQTNASLVNANPVNANRVNTDQHKNEEEEINMQKEKGLLIRLGSSIYKHRKEVCTGLFLATVTAFALSAHAYAPPASHVVQTNNTHQTDNTHQPEPKQSGENVASGGKFWGLGQIAKSIINYTPDVIDDLGTTMYGWFKEGSEVSSNAVNVQAGVSADAVKEAGKTVVNNAIPAKQPSLLSTITSKIAEKAFSLLKTNPRATLLTAAVVCVGIWWKTTKRRPTLRTGKDVVAGTVISPWLSKMFLPPQMAPYFNLSGGAAFFAGRYLLQDTEASKAIKEVVKSKASSLLPNRDALEKFVKKAVPEMPGKDKLIETIHENWGSSNDGQGNNAEGAAEAIGLWASDLVCGTIGLLSLLIAFKLWGWYQKVFNNHTYEPKKAPKTNVAQPQKPKNIQHTTELSDSLFLHIIYSLGIADTAYNLLDKAITMLEEQVEKYTQHQKYKAPSKIEAFKDKAKTKWEAAKLIMLNK